MATEQTGIQDIRPVHPGPYGPTEPSGGQPSIIGIEEHYSENLLANTEVAAEQSLQWIPQSISMVNFGANPVYVSFGQRSMADLRQAPNDNSRADQIVYGGQTRTWPWPPGDAKLKRLRYFVPSDAANSGKLHFIVHSTRYPPGYGDVGLSGGATPAIIVASQYGTQGAGAAFNPPAGGAGLLGYLSGIWEELAAGVAVTGTASGTAIAAGAHTGTVNSADIVNANSSRVQVALNVTVIGTGQPHVHIQGKDPASGSYYDLLVDTTVINANGLYIYRVGPGLTPVPNAVANDIVPRTWRVQVLDTSGNPVTYSVGWNLGA